MNAESDLEDDEVGGERWANHPAHKKKLDYGNHVIQIEPTCVQL